VSEYVASEIYNGTVWCNTSQPRLRDLLTRTVISFGYIPEFFETLKETADDGTSTANQTYPSDISPVLLIMDLSDFSTSAHSIATHNAYIVAVSHILSFLSSKIENIMIFTDSYSSDRIHFPGNAEVIDMVYSERNKEKLVGDVDFEPLIQRVELFLGSIDNRHPKFSSEKSNLMTVQIFGDYSPVLPLLEVIADLPQPLKVLPKEELRADILIIPLSNTQKGAIPEYVNRKIMASGATIIIGSNTHQWISYIPRRHPQVKSLIFSIDEHDPAIARDLKLMLIACIMEIRAKAGEPFEQVFRFHFPPHIATVCEQYLLYFSKFLADIGISATNDIKHEAGQILFSVTPNDPDEALDKIREALHTYLRLPAIVDNNDFSIDQDPTVQQMAANIQHLRGQLMLAAATIRANEAALQSKDISISMLMSQSGPSDILIASALPDPSAKPVDTEQFLGGLIKIGDAEIGRSGVKISLAEIYRRLRERYRKP